MPAPKAISYETRNGQAILPTNKDGTFVRRVDERTLINYCLCQIVPVVPQRFEWVNEANIRERHHP